MKKIYIIPLLFIYLLSSIGVFFNFQYCCGKIKSISVYSLSEDTNSLRSHCQSKDLGKDCCRNEVKVSKTVNDQHKLTLQSSFFPFNALLPLIVFFCPSEFQSRVKILFSQGCIKNSPPLYLKNCVFII
jgi:hypothetical protein